MIIKWQKKGFGPLKLLMTMLKEMQLWFSDTTNCWQRLKSNFSFSCRRLVSPKRNFQTVAKVLLCNKRPIDRYCIYERTPYCFKFYLPIRLQLISLSRLYCNITLHLVFVLCMLWCIGWSLTQIYWVMYDLELNKPLNSTYLFLLPYNNHIHENWTFLCYL